MTKHRKNVRPHTSYVNCPALTKQAKKENILIRSSPRCFSEFKLMIPCLNIICYCKLQQSPPDSKLSSSSPSSITSLGSSLSSVALPGSSCADGLLGCSTVWGTVTTGTLSEADCSIKPPGTRKPRANLASCWRQEVGQLWLIQVGHTILGVKTDSPGLKTNTIWGEETDSSWV